MEASQPQRILEIEHGPHWGKAAIGDISVFVRRSRHGQTSLLVDDGPGNTFTLAVSREAEKALRGALDLAACPHHEQEDSDDSHPAQDC